MSSSIDDITGLMVNLSTTDLAQFAWADADAAVSDLSMLNGANESLRILTRASNMVDYAALLRLDSTRYLYSGTVIPDSDIRQILLDHYADPEILLNTPMKGNLLLDCYRDPELNFYCPIYEQYSVSVGEPCALLVVGVSARKMLDYITADAELSLRILNVDGTILASCNWEEAGTPADRFEEYQGGSGQITVGDSMLAYQRAGNGSWIADGVISQHVLFSDVRRTAMLISLVVVFFTLFAIAMSAAFCNRFYTPIREIVAAMKQVTEGNMDIRTPCYQEEDFQLLSEGLNSMLISVNASIEAVQRQERENTEIRLNALQSQIKPHFLYIVSVINKCA